MGCLTIGTSSFEIFSYLFSAFYLWQAVQLGQTIYANWQTFTKPDFNRTAQSWANSAAFLIAVPPAVLVHEFFHAFAIWGYGGRVINCGYGFYWGFVQANQIFSPSQEWVIAIMGTVGSLLFGLTLWLALRNHAITSIRYFALRALRFQIFFALIYYPIFTVVLSIGDWRTIYNFAQTPLLSGLTVIPHVVLLGLFWWWDRNGRFEPATFIPLPIEGKPLMEQFKLLRQLGESNSPNTYQKYVTQFKAEHPERTDLNFMLTAFPFLSQNKKIPTYIVQLAKETIEKGTDSSRIAHMAYGVQIQYAMDIGQYDEALTLINTLEKELASHLPEINFIQARFQRATIYRRQNQYHKALTELKQLRDLAQRHKLDTTPYDREITLVERHRHT